MDAESGGTPIIKGQSVKGVGCAGWMDIRRSASPAIRDCIVGEQRFQPPEWLSGSQRKMWEMIAHGTYSRLIASGVPEEEAVIRAEGSANFVMSKEG